MVLIKEIELALKPKDTEVVGQEDDVLVDSVLELENTNLTQQDSFEDFIPGSIRKHVEADMRVAYPGKPTSRKRIFNSSFQQKESEKQLDHNDSNDTDRVMEDEQLSDGEDEQLSGGEDEQLSEEEDELLSDEEDEQLSDEEDEQLSDEEDEQLSDEDVYDISRYLGKKQGIDSEDDVDSEDADDSKLSEAEIKSDDTQGINIFSARARDIKSDIAKGRSIRNQLTIWEKLIECRIKLQPGLINTNKLFQCDVLKDFKKQLNSEDEEIVNQTYSVLSDLMKKLLELQDMTLNASPEYKEMNGLKRKNDGTNEEEPEMKKIRSTDFLQEIHDEFKPFKDAVIQKWNEKTRLSHGRMSKSDFSAFDQPTLKQIEEILLDRERLLRRTRTKRSDYPVLGKALLTSDEELKKDSSRVKHLQEYDPEIFDDDDFYHKLLRDFIDNKTSDASDISKRGRQWLELQKLRSRMKAKVDTRASKGRKIRYTVHNKMVNFMAPIPSHSWTDGAKNELFKSLFGQALQQAE